MSMTARNFFINGAVTSNYSRPLYNPVIGTATSIGGVGGGGSGELALIDTANYNFLNMIEELYGLNMANKNYESIPNDYDKYVTLYTQVTQILYKSKDERMKVLLKLAQEALQGAINSYAIYGSNIALTYDKAGLQKLLADCESGINKKVVATATGQISITKRFKLATVFNCYLYIYGMPEAGVGFDPIKINYLVDVLRQNGIDPYK
jgi:hypothetical protein